MRAGRGADVAALLELVRTHPGDDDVRRVLGDALAERGEPRGHLITREGRPWNPDARAIAYAEVLPGLLGDLFGQVEPVHFHLGFLDEARDLGRAPIDSPVWSTVTALDTDAEELVAALPALDRLSTRFELVRRGLSGAPLGVRHLWPVEVPLDAALDGLPQQPGHWASVEALALTSTDDEPRGALYGVAGALLDCGLPLRVLRVETRQPPPGYLRERFAELGGQRLEWRNEALVVREGSAPRGPPVAYHPPVPLPSAVAARVVGRHSTGRYVAWTPEGAALWQWPVPDNRLRASRSPDDDEAVDLGRRRRVGLSVVNEVAPALGPGPAPWPASSIEQARKVVVRARRHVPHRYRLAETTLEALAFVEERGCILGPRVHPRGSRDRLLERLALRGDAEIAWAGVTVTARPAVDARSAYGTHPSGVVALAEGLGGQPRTELAASAVVAALAEPGSPHE
ncbi:MAG: hypothetical protein AAF211_31520, partial [Myxococcota bacterium]